ncbi:MAG TPA: NAD(P)H-hydrate epimerase, partial [Anaerolineaceae bacterium]|nr:NAD(P)H-hydrate epimerase [Anaerolineaceae bacterium]
MKLVSVAEMKSIEAEADARGLSYAEMMDRAGEGVAQAVRAATAHSHEGERRVAGLVGPGNNGGDALVALESLSQDGWTARAYLVQRKAERDALVSRLQDAGGEVMAADSDPEYELLRQWVAESDVLIDGLLGTGLKLPLRGTVPQVLAAIQETEGLPMVVAVDCPSGADSDTGEAAPETLRADLTVCMAAVKTGLLKFPACALTGELVIVDLGLPAGLKSWEGVQSYVVTEDRVRGLLPARPDDAHKGTFGTATLVVGSVNYTGAALLAGEAAYRSGTGLVRLAVPSPLHSPLAGQLPEAIWLLLPHEDGVISGQGADLVFEHLGGTTAVLLGCGWGREEATGDFL